MLVRTMRVLGALAVLGVGAVHLQQYIGADYRVIPTVGPLFLLNAISAAVVGVGLLVPVERGMADRTADATVGLLALAAIGIAVGSLAALFISETSSLFGFSEAGYRTPIVLAIITEAATMVLLTPVAAKHLARFARPRENRPRSDRVIPGAAGRG